MSEIETVDCDYCEKPTPVDQTHWDEEAGYCCFGCHDAVVAQGKKDEAAFWAEMEEDAKFLEENKDAITALGRQGRYFEEV